MFKQFVKISMTIGLILFFASSAYSCVGRILYIGILDTLEQKLIAEHLVLLINERTGTKVQIRYFENSDQIYEALKCVEEEKRADIIIESTTNALKILDKTPGSELNEDYFLVKKLYEEQFDLIWLYPFGFSNGKGQQEKSLRASVLRRDVMTNFPLLPRILKKLAGAIDEVAFAHLMEEAEAGKKPKNIALDFLRTKKLI
jgi:glycine betaine/choline ABC-type transport system substrate-binding protein